MHGPSVITRVFLRGRQEGIFKREDVTKEAEVGMMSIKDGGKAVYQGIQVASRDWKR